MPQQSLLPVFLEAAVEVYGRQEAAEGCHFHPSAVQAVASHPGEEVVCDHRVEAVDSRFRPSEARGVSFLRPFFVLLSNVVRIG